MKLWKKIMIGIVVSIVLVWVGTNVWLYLFFGQNNLDWEAEGKFEGDLSLEKPNIPEGNCNIVDFGASVGKESGENIQKAIDACESRGGGTVIIPAGVWVTGPLEMKDRIRLLLEKDAHLVFDAEKKRYERGVSNRFEGIEMVGLTPLVYGQKCQDVMISGEGTIDGNGSAWQGDEGRRGNERTIFDTLQSMVAQETPVDKRVFISEELFARPDTFLFNGCDRVSVEGVTISNGPRWTMHFLYSQNILIRGVHIETEGANTDGIVVDSSKDVHIDSVQIHSGDDAIVMKSGLDADGRRVGIPTERVVIQNVAVDGAHGGIVIGSEMSGGVRDVLAKNISVKNAWFSTRIKAPKGRGGFVRNIRMRDFSYENISQNAIHIDMDYTYNVATEDNADEVHAPNVENISFINFRGSGAQRAIDIDGLPQNPIKNIVIDQMHMQGGKGVSLRYVSGVFIARSSFEIHIGNVDKKNVFSLEGAEAVFGRDIDCRSLGAEQCVDIGKNKEGRSVFLTQGIQWPVQRGKNIILGPSFWFLFPHL